jgi:hypothetical protein
MAAPKDRAYLKTVSRNDLRIAKVGCDMRALQNVLFFSACFAAGNWTRKIQMVHFTTKARGPYSVSQSRNVSCWRNVEVGRDSHHNRFGSASLRAGSCRARKRRCCPKELAHEFRRCDSVDRARRPTLSDFLLCESSFPFALFHLCHRRPGVPHPWNFHCAEMVFGAAILQRTVWNPVCIKVSAAVDLLRHAPTILRRGAQRGMDG